MTPNPIPTGWRAWNHITPIRRWAESAGAIYFTSVRAASLTARPTALERSPGLAGCMAITISVIPHVVDVDVLKGVNMSCRKTLYRPIDSRLAQGGQRHWEIDLCLTVRAAGYRLVYDPAIRVDHYHFGADRAPIMRPEYIYANSHNLTLCQVKHRSGWKRAAFVTYDLLWGDLPEMGLAVFLRTYLKQLRSGRRCRIHSPARREHDGQTRRADEIGAIAFFARSRARKVA